MSSLILLCLLMVYEPVSPWWFAAASALDLTVWLELHHIRKVQKLNEVRWFFVGRLAVLMELKPSLDRMMDTIRKHQENGENHNETPYT